ncbi:MAG TPA: discoidin domain-containing protein, partial [Planctomycetaceae bacterium]
GGIIPETESSLVASGWSQDRSVLATVHADNSIRLRDPKDGHTLKVAAAPVEILPALALSPDGRRLVAAGEDRALYLWDVAGEISPPHVLRGHTGRVTCVAFTPDGKSIFSGSTDGSLRQWGAASGSPGLVMDAGIDKLLCLACGDDGRWLAAGGHGRSVHLWNLAQPAAKPALSLGGHSGAVTAMAFAADRPLLASAGEDNSLLLWNLDELEPETGAAPRLHIEPQRLVGHQKPVQCLAFLRGDRLATASQDGTIRLWETDSGTASQVLNTAAFIQSLAFAVDDFSLLSVGSDRTLGVWHASFGIAFAAKEGRYLKLKALSEIGGGSWTAVGEIRVFAGETRLPTRQWTLVSVDSEAQGAPAMFAFDGNPRTFWSTRWRSRVIPPHPHEIVIDLGKVYRLTAFSVLPRNDGNPNGTIKDYELYVGNDPQDFGPPVSKGKLADGPPPSP